ncbi:hypothetical protein [Gracilinema caldarium]|uniref:Polysaccharide lyase family 1 modular protein with two candidate pectate lyase domains n=1 Tax=Gracilinema caldarium (strain ATCC 51460 / DSM 7334 / H1) TaxID=744872 RepID=F8F1E8_GRAC1|nr:hypothetical protein [Gracilinema caldarium]AEJ18792.1 polysaccharide lyase family 1 modular protein with two candidate pectate lyase domains [Gracilinema caldarium DSM 7334]
MVKKFVIIIGLALFLSIPVMSQVIISANDLNNEQVTNVKIVGDVKILAKPDKAVSIEAMDVPRESVDGEVFNNRIKLNGSGTLEYRAIVLNLTKKGQLTVYCNSSSKTDTRILVLVNAVDGNIVSEGNAEPDLGTKAGMCHFNVPNAGLFLLYSKSGGINIYQINQKTE